MSKCRKCIDLKPINQIYELINSDVFAKVFNDEKQKENNNSDHLNWNKLCTAIIRIEDTVDYVNDLNICHKNLHKEAFNFYELLNCFSIILGCVVCLFKEFKMEIENVYGQKKTFLKSNKSDSPDIKFFKFVRSACAVHPENTTRYQETTKTKDEIYPYAIWNDECFYAITSNFPKDCDVILTAWKSDQSSLGKEYYLYIDEFYEFINDVVSCSQALIPVIEKRIGNYKLTTICSNLRGENEFAGRCEYCLYLRGELLSKSGAFQGAPDGGLLVASHLFSNEMISSNFKDVIFGNVLTIKEQMAINVDRIGFYDVFLDFMNLEDIENELKTEIWFCLLKEAEFLADESKREIEQNQAFPFRDSPEFVYEETFANARFAAKRITSVKGLFDEELLKKTISFPDLFDLLLQSVWEKKRKDLSIRDEKDE